MKFLKASELSESHQWRSPPTWYGESEFFCLYLRASSTFEQASADSEEVIVNASSSSAEGLPVIINQTWLLFRDQLGLPTAIPSPLPVPLSHASPSYALSTSHASFNTSSRNLFPFHPFYSSRNCCKYARMEAKKMPSPSLRLLVCPSTTRMMWVWSIHAGENVDQCCVL